mgnify:FL=1
MDPKQHTYVVKWLTEDQACVGLCVVFFIKLT